MIIITGHRPEKSLMIEVFFVLNLKLKWIFNRTYEQHKMIFRKQNENLCTYNTLYLLVHLFFIQENSKSTKRTNSEVRKTEKIFTSKKIYFLKLQNTLMCKWVRWYYTPPLTVNLGSANTSYEVISLRHKQSGIEFHYSRSRIWRNGIWRHEILMNRISRSSQILRSWILRS